MAWTEYHTEIELTVGANTYPIPVWRLTARAIPYSGSGQIAEELFDGRKIQRIDGWRHQVEASWDELKGSDHSTLQDAIEDLAANGPGTLSLDPGNAKDLSVILEDAQDTLQAVFDGRLRNRPGSVTFVTTQIDTTPKSWITD